MAQSARLRIAVVGAGSVGSTFAFYLARHGNHDVTAVARPGSLRLQQLQRDKGIIKLNGERADVRTADGLAEHIVYDLVIVTLLAHQVDPVLPVLARSAAKCIQFMFNNFDPERLQDAIGADRCSFGMPFVQASIDSNGKLKATVGAAGQKSLMSRQKWVEVFNAAGLPAVVEPQMLLWLRCHAPLCVAFESVSAAGMRRGGGASWAESIVIARGMRECFRLISRQGFQLYPAGKATLNRCPVWLTATMLWCMSRITSFRELLATGVHECCALIDTMAAAAARVNPPIAVNKLTAMKPESQR